MRDEEQERESGLFWLRDEEQEREVGLLWDRERKGVSGS